MTKENIIKILIPLVAIVVVIESVTIISKLNNTTQSNNPVSQTEEIMPTEEVKSPVASFIFETDSKKMVVGKPYTVNLSLTGIENVDLDAMELYIDYDPEKVTVSKLTTDENLPQLTQNSGIDSETGLISSMFLWDVGETYSVKTDETTLILSFVVTPKVEDISRINLLTKGSTDESTSIIVESLTSEPLNFLANNLEIDTTK
jgi:hypothetical protein